MPTPTELTPDLLRRMPLPRLDAGSKDERGRAMVIGGSVEVPGGVLLAANAVLRAGAGKVQVATVASCAQGLALAIPEALVIGFPETPEGGLEAEPAIERLVPRIGRCDAVLVGPGMAQGDATVALTEALLAGDEASFVLDAAALDGLPDHPETVRSCGGRVVMTPHAGEMAKLLGREREAIEDDPLAAACEAADRFGAVVVMKGARTCIVAPDGRAWSYAGGGVGLATSGSGDVLAGLVTGLIARGAPVAEAALWGVHLHGEAGRRLARSHGPVGFLARELGAEVPRLLHETGREA
ncbi:NAD(P)H-hydrate dehydratase [Methylobacterium oryzihabitans]|uniref:ADP-dependent (S)-NAD(P)H-hydrate dehydratase n=1 Tax=Methylobacterium oryzihabitans TaxID=2499852 RepID=A0A437PBY6_9HYPH|nr:NAD(P)H-hydrate dehydratase [Methylobacterium oryzihabitans]RVU19777.1 NAD(P)H-hydrate dehydratase [Methylobacterium oryzihabitans]